MARVKSVMSIANRAKATHMEHSYLWTESRQEFMHYFLTYGRYIF